MAELQSESHQPHNRCQTSPHQTCHTAEHEQLLLDHLDGHLPTAQNRAVAEHLAGCAQCAALARQWKTLDADLRAHFGSHALSSNFAERLWRKIDTEPIAAAQAAAALQPRSVEAEWSVSWAGQKRQFFWTHLPSVLDNIGYGFVVGLAALLAWRTLPQLSQWLLQMSQNTSSPAFVTLLAGAGVLTLVLVLTLTARRPLARLFAAL
jgi:anti-sigma factor RsiW